LGGGAVGARLALALVQGSQSPSPPATDALEDQISRLDESSKTLSENIARLESRLDQALARLDQRLTERVELPPPVGQDVTARPKEKDTPVEEARGKEEGKFAWITVIDGGIARVLVERGLTPYDPNVAPLVRKAGDALRTNEAEYKKAISPWLDLHLEGEMNVREYQKRITPFVQEQSGKRKIILEKLASALDALPKE